jgi:hypothetical protein
VEERGENISISVWKRERRKREEIERQRMVWVKEERGARMEWREKKGV